MGFFSMGLGSAKPTPGMSLPFCLSSLSSGAENATSRSNGAGSGLGSRFCSSAGLKGLGCLAN